MDSAVPPTLASSLGLGESLFQHHLASFLDSRSRAALASTCRRLHHAAAPDSYSTACIDDWRFLACFVGQGAARPLRWRCWLPDARTERLFLHAALSRYEAFLTRLLPLAPRQDVPPSTNATIPRIIHHIWLGSTFPARFEAWRASYREHHPDWEHRLWTEAEVAAAFPHGLRNQAAFDAAANYGEKADILRYEVLNRFGGLYVDVDMECLRPHDALHATSSGCSLYAGFSHTGTVELNNGVIGTAPGHPLLGALMERIYAEHEARSNEEEEKEKQRARHTQLASILGFLGQGEATAVRGVVSEAVGHQAALSTIERTGPGLLTRCAERLLSSSPLDGDGLLLLPPQWFYALPNTAAAEFRDGVEDGHQEHVKRFVASGVALAVHHWARSWQQQPPPPSPES